MVLLAAIAVVAAACGDGGDTIEIDGAAATGSDDTGAVDAEGEADPAEEDATGEDDTAEDAAEDEPEPEAGGDEGLAAHRPSGAARAAIDCGAVANPVAGALIAFPNSDNPDTLQAGPGPVTVEVVGCSDTFEANVQYDAFHGQDSVPTLSGFTMGGSLGAWDVFSFEETYWTPGDWTVVVFVDDAESGDRVEYDQVTFTVD
jgi:hypothetical protein